MEGNPGDASGGGRHGSRAEGVVGTTRLVFSECELDTDRVELRRGGTLVHVEPQVFDVLAYLVAHRDRVVMKSELLDRVWGDRFVSESTLTSRIKEARRAVGDDGAAQRCIRTVHGRGYQFVAPVEERAGESALEPAPRPASRSASATRRTGSASPTPSRATGHRS